MSRFAALALVLLSRGVWAEGVSLSAGWTARAGAVFAPQASLGDAWRMRAEKSGVQTLDLTQQSGQAVAYVLSRRGVTPDKFYAMTPERRFQEAAKAKETIREAVKDAAVRTADPSLSEEDLQATGEDLNRAVNDFGSILDKDALRIAESGVNATRERIERRLMAFAQDNAKSLNQSKPRDELLSSEDPSEPETWRRLARRYEVGVVLQAQEMKESVSRQADLAKFRKQRRVRLAGAGSAATAGAASFLAYPYLNHWAAGGHALPKFLALTSLLVGCVAIRGALQFWLLALAKSETIRSRRALEESYLDPRSAVGKLTERINRLR